MGSRTGPPLVRYAAVGDMHAGVAENGYATVIRRVQLFNRPRRARGTKRQYRASARGAARCWRWFRCRILRRDYDDAGLTTGSRRRSFRN